jgi:predicted DNA-binding transcriptional regulator AlpA
MNELIVMQESVVRLLIREEIQTALQQFPPPRFAPQAVEETLFNAAEAAAFLNVAMPTFYEYTSKNQIPYFKKFKKIYCRKSDLIKWLESGKRKTQAEIQQEASSISKKQRK